ncbi:hypothetical protein MCUN1_001745 [Malassezia cuniculi]|uniref:(2E,6E)-farnesyl diphosphate synthase n=1 Tax=Malassezia cuniculi TaxID=948313 RepID=A0AAF0ER43_9BASI|nr:hypothetical protein MCUN1_001745 [Malassezia cuniculi]
MYHSNLSVDARPGGAEAYESVLERLVGEPAWSADKEAAVIEPFRYLDANPGKEIRTRLIDAFNSWLCVSPEALQRTTDIVRRLHTASLLMDDVEDSSALRRGAPTAHMIYGVAQTVNAANYVYFEVMADIVRMCESDTQRFIIDELVHLHRGQGMDLFWRDSLVCPTEAEYVDMVVNKTGGLFRIAIKLMLGSCGKQIPDLIPLVNLIGLLFQIRDDYSNLQSAQLAQHKGFCEDLTEGKFSFPIIHAIRSGASTGGDRELLNILRQRTTSVDTKQRAVDYMANVSHSFER